MGSTLPAVVTPPPRMRRKREAIELPSDVENMDPKEVKKLKNRIAAARLRERSQNQIRELQEQVASLSARNQALEAAVAACPNCSAVLQGQECSHELKTWASPNSVGGVTDQELLPLDLIDGDCTVLEDLLAAGDYAEWPCYK